MNCSEWSIFKSGRLSADDDTSNDERVTSLPIRM